MVNSSVTIAPSTYSPRINAAITATIIKTVSSILNLSRFLMPFTKTFQPASSVAAALSPRMMYSVSGVLKNKSVISAAIPRIMPIISRIFSTFDGLSSSDFSLLSLTVTPSSISSQIC